MKDVKKPQYHPNQFPVVIVVVIVMLLSIQSSPANAKGWIIPLEDWNSTGGKGATVEQITVDNHMYVMVWTSKAHPECRGPHGNGQYILHRGTHWYDNMYSMLLTAAATNKTINIYHDKINSDKICNIRVLKGIKG